MLGVFFAVTYVVVLGTIIQDTIIPVITGISGNEIFS